MRKIFLLCALMAAQAWSDEGLYPLDAEISGEYVKFILKAIEEFGKDQSDAKIENFRIWAVDENEGTVMIYFKPKLTQEEINYREDIEKDERSKGNDVIWIRHHPENEFGESAAYHFSKSNGLLLRKELNYAK